MKFITIGLVLLAVLPSFITSLQCNVCREGIRLNYTMTSSTVPPLPSDCQVVNAPVCWVSVFWELDFNTTFLDYRARPGASINAPSRDLVTVRILRAMERDNQTLSSGRELNYECDSSDKCNSPASLQKLIGALTVQDQFQQEVAPLLKLVRNFDPRAADCVYFHNTTFRCPPPDLRRCHRCTIDSGEQLSRGEDVCATCEVNESRDNFVERGKAFVLSNRTLDFDFAVLGCQLKGCNSVNNVNLVYQASKITFNYDEYYKK